MVIRLDSARLKSVVNNKTEPIGVEGDPATNVAHGMTEADKIVEGARKSMANAGITDPETAEQAEEETLQRMANKSEAAEAELFANEHNDLPSVDPLTSTHASQETK
jgi:protein phosphatase PTC1